MTHDYLFTCPDQKADNCLWQFYKFYKNASSEEETTCKRANACLYVKRKYLFPLHLSSFEASTDNNYKELIMVGLKKKKKLKHYKRIYDFPCHVKYVNLHVRCIKLLLLKRKQIAANIMWQLVSLICLPIAITCRSRKLRQFPIITIN